MSDDQYVFGIRVRCEQYIEQVLFNLLKTSTGESSSTILNAIYGNKPYFSIFRSENIDTDKILSSICCQSVALYPEAYKTFDDLWNSIDEQLAGSILNRAAVHSDLIKKSLHDLEMIIDNGLNLDPIERKRELYIFDEQRNFSIIVCSLAAHWWKYAAKHEDDPDNRIIRAIMHRLAFEDRSIEDLQGDGDCFDLDGTSFDHDDQVGSQSLAEDGPPPMQPASSASIKRKNRKGLTPERAREYLEAAGGNKSKAAEMAGCSRMQFYRILNQSKSQPKGN